MPSSIDSDLENERLRRPSTTSSQSANMSTSHPIQQLDEVIKQADKADPPGRAKDLLKPIQENIKVRERHHEDCLKEKDAQVLALKLELSKAKLVAKDQDENLTAMKGELRGAKRDIRRLKDEARNYGDKLRGLEAERAAWMKGNDIKIIELEDAAKELEATRADLQNAVAFLNNTIKEQKSELFDLKAKDIAQRGEIHFLKKDVEQLQVKVELNRAATDWLAHNGPSLKDDFFSLRNEAAELKAKGAEIARLMIKGAREWEEAVGGKSQVGMNPEGLDTRGNLSCTGESVHGASGKRSSCSLIEDDMLEMESRPEQSGQGKRRRIEKQAEVDDPYCIIHPEEDEILENWEPRPTLKNPPEKDSFLAK
ncbi:hypothetical protein BKA61DRAFT_680320 [Leptodontidium sp. MPI-SDFR-AT-0119]|nr:hypothetical protein BKA61DRAFT_680320 [Leptodontidium sp. MPI-SDFR-AT-0119]